MSVWPWKSSQRARLHLLAAETEGTVDLRLANDDTGRVETRSGVPRRLVNPSFYDVGMVGPAVQCSVEDGTCDAMERVFDGYLPRLSLEQSARYMVNPTG